MLALPVCSSPTAPTATYHDRNQSPCFVVVVIDLKSKIVTKPYGRKNKIPPKISNVCTNASEDRSSPFTSNNAISNQFN